MRNIEPTQEEIGKVLSLSQSGVSKTKNKKRKLTFMEGLKLKKTFNWTDKDVLSFISEESLAEVKN